MLPSQASQDALDAPARGPAVLALLLGAVGIPLFFWASLPGSSGRLQLFFEEYEMWVKVLGLICAGVFVGAALVEAKQLRKRKRAGREAEQQDAGPDDDDVERAPDAEAAQNG